MGFIRIFLSLFVQVTSTALLLYCVLSWFVPPDFPVRRWLDSIIDPMLNPIRQFMPNIGMFDLSPIILMLLLQFLLRIINSF